MPTCESFLGILSKLEQNLNSIVLKALKELEASPGGEKEGLYRTSKEKCYSLSELSTELRVAIKVEVLVFISKPFIAIHSNS